MEDFKEGDLCHRCKSTPILDARMPFCSGCRKILQKETVDTLMQGKDPRKRRFRITIPALKGKYK
jgi:hypothetical protein